VIPRFVIAINLLIYRGN